MNDDRESGAPEPVLAGVKVVDFTHIFAGPYATQILGDLGAEVIKIERVDGGDPSRYYGVTDASEAMSGPFLAVNRNKSSVAVNMSSGEGRQIIARLVKQSDVVVENFSEGVMRRWALDYDTLKEENPSLVYCSISGFGRKGPLAEKRANDLVVQAYSGLLSFTGEPGRPPVRCGTAISDFSAGLNAALGIVSALFSAHRTGKGQLVETSLIESSLGMMSYFFAEYWTEGIVPGPMGTANRLGMPNQAFPTADGYIAITAANDRMWQRCAAALGTPDLARDPRFETLADRYRNREELVAMLSDLTGRMTTADCLQALEREGVSCAPINSVAEVANDPLLETLDAVLDVPVQGGWHERVVGPSFHLSSTPTVVSRPVPRLGGNTIEVLRGLGYGESEIDRLVASGVVAQSASARPGSSEGAQ